MLLWACILLLLSAGTGCGRTGDAAKGQGMQAEKLQIVTTIYPPYDFAKNVGGDLVEVTMLLKPGMESHSYEPTPADMIRIMKSDIFLYAGGESDVWVEELLGAGETNTRAYPLLDWVDPIEEETVEGMQTKGHTHEHEEDEECHHDTEDDEAVHLHEGEYDEHVWTSPQNAMLIVGRLEEIFSELDPENGGVYQENTRIYLEKLEALDQTFRTVTQNARHNTLIFGDRFPLLYFVRTYGLDYYAAFPGCSMETEPSASMVAFLTDKVKEEQIPVIFYLELSNGKIAEAIAECTDAQTAVFYSGHAITADDLEAGEDYISLMYRNVDSLKTALGEKK